MYSKLTQSYAYVFSDLPNCLAWSKVSFLGLSIASSLKHLSLYYQRVATKSAASNETRNNIELLLDYF